MGVLTLGFNSASPPENTSSELLNSVGKHIGSLINRRRIEAERNELFNAEPNVACILVEGLITKVNTAMCHLMEYSAEQLLFRPLETLIHPDDLPASQFGIEGKAARKQNGQ